jgi:transcriptional regulator with XRE-family HTH domain
MADSNPLSLTDQLAARVKSFCGNLGLSQNKLARLLKVDDGQFSKFLAGKTNISPEKTLKLLQLMNLSSRDLELKFGNPDRITSRITKLQQCRDGQPSLRLDNDGWYPGTGGSGAGTDPVGSTDITGTNANPAREVSDDDELEFLAGLAGLHQSIIDKINAWQARAQVNRVSSTEGTRYTPDNAISSRPGIRGDKFGRK